MKPVEFDEQTMEWQAPEGMSDCQPLPAHKTPEGQSISCWKATWRDRLRILFTGRVWLGVWGRQPPVWIESEFPFVPFATPPVSVLTEGRVRKGGVNPGPTAPRPKDEMKAQPK